MNSLLLRRRFNSVGDSFWDGIAVSRDTNAPLMSALWEYFGTNGTISAGLIANENFVTKQEAAIIPIVVDNSAGYKGIFYHKGIVTANELQYFTNPNNNFRALFSYTDTYNTLNPSAVTDTTLTSITFPNVGNSVSTNAMCIYCNSLTNVTITTNPYKTELDGAVFRGCTSLTKIVLPPNITEVHNNVFYGCPDLNRIIGNTITFSSDSLSYTRPNIILFGNIPGTAETLPTSYNLRYLYVPTSIYTTEYGSDTSTKYIIYTYNPGYSSNSTAFQVIPFDVVESQGVNKVINHFTSEELPSDIQTEIINYKLQFNV